MAVNKNCEEILNNLKECLEYYNNDFSLDRYVLESGMSGVLPYSRQEDKYKYICDLVETLIIWDILQKYAIRNKNIIRDFTFFMMDNISSLTSANNLSKEIGKANLKISNKKIKQYIEYLTRFYLFYKIRRYDIKGKKYLNTNNKYYLVDHSFRYASLGRKNMDYEQTYENIIVMELFRCGYEVYVGKLYQKEIDFVAIKQNEKIYIQVSDDISNKKHLNMKYHRY